MRNMYKMFVEDNDVNLELIGGIPTDVNQFVADLNSQVSKVNPINGSLNIDCIRLITPNSKDMKIIMTPCFQLYASYGFKEINVIVYIPQKCFKRNIEELLKKLGIMNGKVTVIDNMQGMFGKKRKEIVRYDVC